MTKLPVFNDTTKDAMIIGYASSEIEAKEVFIETLKDAGNDSDYIAETSTAMNFRVSGKDFFEADYLEFADITEANNGCYTP